MKVEYCICMRGLYGSVVEQLRGIEDVVFSERWQIVCVLCVQSSKEKLVCIQRYTARESLTKY